MQREVRELDDGFLNARKNEDGEFAALLGRTLSGTGSEALQHAKDMGGNPAAWQRRIENERARQERLLAPAEDTLDIFGAEEEQAVREIHMFIAAAIKNSMATVRIFTTRRKKSASRRSVQMVLSELVSQGTIDTWRTDPLHNSVTVHIRPQTNC